MSKRKVFLLALSSGILLGLSFPPLPFNLFAFFALVPLLILFDLDKPPKHKYRLLYMVFFIYHGASNWWISSWQSNTDPYLFVSGLAVWVVHPFFFLVPFFAYFFARKRFGTQKALWLMPFFWVSFEWLHSLGDLAYPWLTLGYTQVTDRLFSQVADIAGVWGLSFLVVMMNVLITKALLAVKEVQQNGLKTSIFGNPYIRNIITAILLLYFLPIIYGGFRLHEFEHNKLLKENPSINIGLIQPNINPWDKWAGGIMRQIALHQEIQDSLRRAVKRLDLAIWSETAVHYVNLSFNADHDFGFLQEWVDRTNTPLLTGFADLYLYPRGSKGSASAKPLFGDKDQLFDSFNSVLLLSPKNDNKQAPIYHKMRLTPFGETIPYIDQLSFLRPWLEWNVGISSWKKGSLQHNLEFSHGGRKISIGPIICIESVYPGFVRNLTEMGAGVLVVITNDGWYDHTTGPEQHYMIAAMRAIENRRYVARCANTGVTGFIAPDGGTVVRAPQYTSTGIAATIPDLRGGHRSIYSLIGDIPVITALIISILAILWGIISKFMKKADK